MLPDTTHTATGLLAPAAVRAGLAELIEPPPDLTVTEAAEKYRVLHNPGGGYSGPYRAAMAPYCRAPQDSLSSRLYNTTVFVGPGQCGKSEIPLNWAVYSICADPADMLLVLDEKDQAEDFIDRRVKRLNQYCDEVFRRLVDEKRYTRTYRGMLFTVLWATGSKAASKPAPRIALDERDSMDDDLNGEGDPYELFAKRAITFGDAGHVFVGSSPKKPVRKSKSARTGALGPHEAPRTTGILALYNQGTRKRHYWPCPQCGEFHTPEFDMLHWADDADPADPLFRAWLVCPANGCVIEEADKPAMLARGEWIAEGQTIDSDGRIHGAAPSHGIDSYWLKGLSSAFMGWPALVRKYLDATAEFEDTGSDAKLKTFWQLEIAEPYTPPEGEDDVHLDHEALMNRAEPQPLGVVPAAARFLTAAIDVQGNRFEVEVRAWGAGLQSWVVERYAVFKAPDASAPGGERPVDPGANAADWDLLFDAVLNKTWPIEGHPGRSARIACTALDAAGAPGVTTEAYDFWRRARRRRFGRTRFMLTKGGTSAAAPLIGWSRPESNKSKRVQQAGSYAELATINVAALKDVANRRLTLDAPGPNYLHFSDQLDEKYFLELTAESKIDGKWVKERQRNEAWDQLVMGIAVTLHLRANRIDWDRPPPWAAPWPDNRYAADLTVSEAAGETSNPSPPPPGAAATAAPTGAAPQPARPSSPRAAAPDQSRRRGFAMPADGTIDA